MYRIVWFVLLSMLPMKPAYAQNDTARYRPSWTNFRPALQIGIGIMPRFFAEPGIALRKSYISDHGGLAFSLYSTVEIMTVKHPDEHKLLLAPKIGCQLSVNIGLLALETKYMSDGLQSDFVIVPKIGYTLLGLANLSYGYQISLHKRPFPGIRAHQFSFSFLLHHELFLNKKKTEKN